MSETHNQIILTSIQRYHKRPSNGDLSDAELRRSVIIVMFLLSPLSVQSASSAVLAPASLGQVQCHLEIGTHAWNNAWNQALNLSESLCLVSDANIFAVSVRFRMSLPLRRWWLSLLGCGSVVLAQWGDGAARLGTWSRQVKIGSSFP